MCESPRLVTRLIGVSSALAIALGAAGCAPEPTTVAGQIEKGSETSNEESSWGAPVEEFDAEVKSTELPATFPTDLFPLPEAAVIDNAGQRDESWFVVLRAPDEGAAASLWLEIISLGGFSEGETAETTEGGKAAVLTSASLTVTAVTIPQADGSILLSYDLTQNAV